MAGDLSLSGDISHGYYTTTQRSIRFAPICADLRRSARILRGGIGFCRWIVRFARAELPIAVS